MLLSTQFLELFREEMYAVNLALNDNRELDNPFDDILSHRPIDGLWTREYSVVPIGELSGRNEANPIPEKNMVMGYTCYGAQSIEASGKVSISKTLEQRGREFRTADGIDEARFAGYLADTAARGFLSRRKTKWHRLASDIFNLGAIPAGNAFFNHRTRTNGLSDLPNTPLQYDLVALFALPGAPHPSYAANALLGPGSRAVGTAIDMAGAIADTGGYFNRFDLAPSYWALKRVWTHFCFNMQFDENDVRYYAKPDTLLVSSYNRPRWDEVLKSRFIEPRGVGGSQYSTNRENIFVNVEGYDVEVIDSPFLIANTWFLGKRKSGGISLLDPAVKEDPWAYYRDEDNRSYFISYEDQWGFLVRNWRCWVAGAASGDGVTPPNFNNITEENWDSVPAGV
jgi:hypothetical protein